MKKIICLLLTAGYAAACIAQSSGEKNRIFLGLNFKGGKVHEHVALMQNGWIYPGGVNSEASEAEIKNDNAFGFDAQAGYFFGRKANVGISTGLVYFRNEGVLTVESMHFEYKSTDFNNDVFRQVVTTAKPITEALKTTNISIPLLFKYRTMFSKRIGMTVDAGLVYNVQVKTSYDAKASFNYEAIYKFGQEGNDYVAVYDNSPVPDADDWLITVDEYHKDKGDGNVDAYFEKLAGQGYNVGLNKEASGSGTVAHKTGSLGWLVQPSLNFQLNDMFSLNVGPYMMMQSFKNTPGSLKSRITDKIGEYNSVLNNTVSRQPFNYGLNLGLSVSF